MKITTLTEPNPRAKIRGACAKRKISEAILFKPLGIRN